MRLLPLFASLALTSPLLAAAQGAPDAGQPLRTGPGEIALAPTRFELPLKPGSSKTVVVNVISAPGAPGAKPLRLLASLGDWTLTRGGEIQFARPGTLPRSATDWLIYSPVEMSVVPGETHSIRVTIDVPQDAAPGDYTSVLFVEERPPDLKHQANTRQIMFQFRLAAIFYVMVPPLTTKGALTGISAELKGPQLLVMPTLQNEGNTRLRPDHTLQLVNAKDEVLFESTAKSSTPVLAGATYQPVLTIDKLPPPGEYTLRYRVDFKDGSKVIEGRKPVVIPPPAPPPAPAPAKKPSGKKR